MSDLFKENTANTANGFFNLALITKNGEKRSLGGILDHAKLGKKEKALLELLVAQGADGHAVTLQVTYNTFSDSTETTLDEL